MYNRKILAVQESLNSEEYAGVKNISHPKSSLILFLLNLVQNKITFTEYPK